MAAKPQGSRAERHFDPFIDTSVTMLTTDQDFRRIADHSVLRVWSLP
jgi:hypothetical protein